MQLDDQLLIDRLLSAPLDDVLAQARVRREARGQAPRRGRLGRRIDLRGVANRIGKAV